MEIINYYDIDEILTGEQSVPATFSIDCANLGYLAKREGDSMVCPPLPFSPV
jgi:hypothetical protein